jgi:hypothetical protein
MEGMEDGGADEPCVRAGECDREGRSCDLEIDRPNGCIRRLCFLN